VPIANDSDANRCALPSGPMRYNPFTNKRLSAMVQASSVRHGKKNVGGRDFSLV